MNCKLSKRYRVYASFGRALAFVAAACTGPLHAGIPEPDFVWYGKVLTQVNGYAVRVTAGTLTWQIDPLPSGTPWIVTTRLTNINDQFSFLLRVPCESPEPGFPAATGIVVLSSSPANYRRLTVSLDGQFLNFISGSNQFSGLQANRGRAERIDLALGALPADTDGDGLADAWEQQFFGGLSANPNQDSDGDGVSNLREYRAGTHPMDAQSRFEFVEIRPLDGGMQLRWSSQPSFRYRLRRSPSLLVPPSSYQLVLGGIDATPPINQFLDTVATGSGQFFYLVEIEE